ncbi:MAG: thioredoxin [Bacteroidota bacterium]
MSQKSNFHTIINSERPVLIDFYADWCGPCKSYSPIIQQLKKDLGDQVKVIKIDVDKNPTLSNNLNVRSIPTTMIYQNGQLKWRAMGAQSLVVLKQQIANLQAS